ncbi:MAG: twin-arginine translocase TatA/TatE family subunit [Gammaproteobacteria bacterium]|nr:twin-arginine translocase TatA/TatE family subunit [Gammaproteobacteria bacterium]MDE0251545.1 twin-arginine translocase TatA/TatE family subunit [Gammaproteobacteria bacterium]MDE0403445.1 twin-arginine translocase TatA/TatE family subunit [Gammaproteobacteria bacterium]
MFASPMEMIFVLVIIFAVVLLIFGTKKLKNFGKDLGSTIKDFRTSVRDGKGENDNSNKQDNAQASSSEESVKTN